MQLRLLLLTSVLVLLATPAVASAAEVRTGATATVGSGETVDDDFFGSGQTVTVAGRVTGDTYASGQTVVVSGIVDGDLLAAAQQVVVDGTVRGDVRAAGAQVTINGVVERSVTAAAQGIDVTSNGRVGGSVVGVGQSVGTFGSIGRGMTIGAETLQIAGPVGGDVLARVENLILTPAASIGGELDYRANRQAATPSGAIGGPVQFEPNDQTESDTPPPLNGLFDIGGLIGLVGSALLGALLIVVAPRAGGAHRTRGPTAATAQPGHRTPGAASGADRRRAGRDHDHRDSDHRRAAGALRGRVADRLARAGTAGGNDAVGRRAPRVGRCRRWWRSSWA